jgi:hypothetical protein
MFWRSARIDEWVAELKVLDAEVSDLRKRRCVLINTLNKAGVAGRLGHRSMVEWVAATLDSSRSCAAVLVYAAGLFARHRRIEQRVVDGEISFDRAVATLRLAETGVDSQVVDSSYPIDLGGVDRLTRDRRRRTGEEERRANAHRFFSIQPTLE